MENAVALQERASEKNLFGGKPHRWVKGQSGNPKGQPKNPEMEELRQAIRQARKKHGRSILNHFVERAFFNDAVLIALIKKFVPDKVHKELDMDDDLRELIGQRVQINIVGVYPDGNKLTDSREVSGSPQRQE